MFWTLSGIKIGEIGNIPNFEFDNQQSYVLDPPIKVLPGDSLVTTCYYNTSNANTTIQGGEETTDEMCDNYLTYYPSQWTLLEPNLFTACSSFEEGALEQYVGFDSTDPFVTLDLGGDIWVDDYQSNPTQNVAPCCGSIGDNKDPRMLEACEAEFLSPMGGPCGVDSDCADDIECLQGVCGDVSSTASSSTVLSIISLLIIAATMAVVSQLA